VGITWRRSPAEMRDVSAHACGHNTKRQNSSTPDATHARKRIPTPTHRRSRARARRVTHPVPRCAHARTALEHWRAMAAQLLAFYIQQLCRISDLVATTARFSKNTSDISFERATFRWIACLAQACHTCGPSQLGDLSVERGGCFKHMRWPQH
jgi:conjugal transfer/entry exclusion protein